MIMNIFNKKETKNMPSNNLSEDMMLKRDLLKLLFNIEDGGDFRIYKLPSAKIDKAIGILKETTKALYLQKEVSISVQRVIMTESQKTVYDMALLQLSNSSILQSQEYVSYLYKETQRLAGNNRDRDFFLNLSGYKYSLILENPSLIEVV